MKRADFNELFGWIESFNPRDPDELRKKIERTEEDLKDLRLQLKESLIAQQQRLVAEAFKAHFDGDPLTDEEADALQNIGKAAYWPSEVGENE